MLQRSTSCYKQLLKRRLRELTRWINTTSAMPFRQAWYTCADRHVVVRPIINLLMREKISGNVLTRSCFHTRTRFRISFSHVMSMTWSRLIWASRISPHSIIGFSHELVYPTNTVASRMYVPNTHIYFLVLGYVHTKKQHGSSRWTRPLWISFSRNCKLTHVSVS